MKTTGLELTLPPSDAAPQSSQGQSSTAVAGSSGIKKAKAVSSQGHSSTTAAGSSGTKKAKAELVPVLIPAFTDEQYNEAILLFTPFRKIETIEEFTTLLGVITNDLYTAAAENDFVSMRLKHFLK